MCVRVCVCVNQPPSVPLSAAEIESLQGRGGSQRATRTLGLAIVPGKHIKSIAIAKNFAFPSRDSVSGPPQCTDKPLQVPETVPPPPPDQTKPPPTSPQPPSDS